MAQKPKRRTNDRFTAPGPSNRNWLRQMLPGGHAAATRADARQMKIEQADVDDFVKMFDQVLDEQYDKDDRLEAPETEAPAEEPEKHSDRWNNLP